MFGFLYEMLGGEHETLPHRRGAPIAAAPLAAAGPSRMGDFLVGEDEPVHADPWLQRGEVPGQPAAAPVDLADDGSVAGELRRLAAELTRRADAATPK
jgi:hypothetical protein